MDAGFFRSHQFIVAAIVATCLVAGGAAAYHYAKPFVSINTGGCSAPNAKGTPVDVTPTIERDGDGRRIVAEYALDANGTSGGAVHLCVPVGEVYVSSSPDDTIRLTARIEGSRDTVESTRWHARFAQLDGGLVVQAWVAQQRGSGSIFGDSDGFGVVFDLQLPLNGAFDLTARADVGDVRAKDLMLGKVDMRTDVGDVKALDVDLGGNATLGTDVGSVTLHARSVQTGTIRLMTDVHDIEALLPLRADIGYDVSASTDVGSVDVDIGDAELNDHESSGPSESWKARTRGHDAKPTKVRVVASTDVGSIDIDARPRE